MLFMVCLSSCGWRHFVTGKLLLEAYVVLFWGCSHTCITPTGACMLVSNAQIRPHMCSPHVVHLWKQPSTGRGP